MIVDRALGSHLGLSPLFPSGAVRAGADIVVQSLHKTLPSPDPDRHGPCQERCLAQEMQRQLSVFETTSPSFLLLASIDGCVELIQDQGDRLFAAWSDALMTFDRMMQGLNCLKVLGYGQEQDQGAAPCLGAGAQQAVYLLSTLNADSMSGQELAAVLRRAARPGRR